MGMSYTAKKCRYGCLAILKNGESCGALNRFFKGGKPACRRPGHNEQVNG